MTSLFFGPRPRRLFGTFHAHQSRSPRATAVLLCNPFGEEALRAHRMYRVLATRLARAGFPVLRFDHFGAGDSAGTSDEATLEDWIDGVGAAAEELRRESSAGRLAVLGLRLGGTLAALAGAKGAPSIHHLLLWDPVVDGAEYLRELAVAHADYMSEELSRPIAPRTNAEGFPQEALGHPLPPALVSSLARVDLAALASLGAEHVTLLTTSDTKALERLRARHAHDGNVAQIAAASSAWNSDAAVNSAVVPMAILEKLITRIEEIAP